MSHPIKAKRLYTLTVPDRFALVLHEGRFREERTKHDTVAYVADPGGDVLALVAPASAPLITSTDPRIPSLARALTCGARFKPDTLVTQMFGCDSLTIRLVPESALVPLDESTD